MLPEKTDTGTRYQVLPQVTDSPFRYEPNPCSVSGRRHTLSEYRISYKSQWSLPCASVI
ncbi:hypothetical protein BN844_2737 [Pseudomonas sp. SHC52]|nr:hypothetical protein BN844_2737 [Pseudomonas sp. SHC52]